MARLGRCDAYLVKPIEARKPIMALKNLKLLP